MKAMKVITLFQAAILVVPNIAWSALLDGDSKNIAWWVILAALFLWWLSIDLCQKGGGWILLGVLIAVFIAIPVTGYALLGGVLLAL